jgi:hypothetical protein
MELMFLDEFRSLYVVIAVVRGPNDNGLGKPALGKLLMGKVGLLNS